MITILLSVALLVAWLCGTLLLLGPFYSRNRFRQVMSLSIWGGICIVAGIGLPILASTLAGGK